MQPSIVMCNCQKSLRRKGDRGRKKSLKALPFMFYKHSALFGISPNVNVREIT